MKLLYSIESKNYGVGRIALSPSFTNKCVLCYSDSITKGNVTIFDCVELV